MSAAPDFTQREERVRWALARPDLFGELYFRPYDPNWSTALPGFAVEMLAFMVGSKRGVVMLPPEFLKTTLGQVYALWLTYRSAAFGTLLRGMLMSEEEGMAKGNLQVIKWHIEQNERLALDFALPDGTPLVRPNEDISRWSDEALIIAREGVSRDPTWAAKGLDSKGTHGRRLDVFIGDDLVTPRNAESPAMRKAALDTMELQVETRMVASGQMLVLSNYNDDKDLPSTLSKRARWQTFRRPSMHVPGKPGVAPKDSQIAAGEWVPTWPDNWTAERLQIEREDKPQRFRRIHLLDPRAEMGERLSVAWLQVIDEEMTPFRYCRFYLGVDGAVGGDSADLDFFSITVLAVSQLHADVVESIAVRGSTGRQVDLLAATHDRYQRIGLGVVAIGVPKAALDAYIKGALTTSRPELVAAKVEAVSTPGRKEERLEGLGPLAQNGWLRVQKNVLHARTSSLHEQHEELTLYEEWRDFPFGKHDDRLDSLDVAQRTAQEFAIVGATEEYEVRVAGRGR